VHEKRIPIRWSDLDGLGHVNQAVYLTFAEEAVDDWFRRRLADVPDYAIVRTTIDYRSELRLEDVEAVGSVELVRVGGSSMTLRCTIRKPDGTVSAEIESVAVSFDREARRSRPLTGEQRAALEA
jgi:acyl-CoA thioester hydrolase